VVGRGLAGLVVGVLLLVPVPRPCAAGSEPCPVIHFSLSNPDHPPLVPLQVAAWDTTFDFGHPEWSGYRCWGRAGFDAGPGKFRLHGGSSLFGRELQLSIADLFVAGGLPAGTPVEVVAELHAHGILEHWMATHTSADFLASLESGSVGDFMEEHAGSPNVPTSFDRILRIPIHARAGEAFEVRAHMFGASGISGYAECDALAEWSFRVETPGATLTSCYGYAGIPTALAPASWGGIKARYR